MHYIKDMYGEEKGSAVFTAVLVLRVRPQITMVNLQVAVVCVVMHIMIS